MEDLKNKDISCIFTDFDGCMSIDGNISEKNREAVHSFLEKESNSMIVISGRPPQSVEYILKSSGIKKEIDRNLHISGYNGSISRFRGSLIIDEPIDFGLALGLLENNNQALVFTNKGISGDPDSPWIKAYLGAAGYKGNLRKHHDVLTLPDAEIYMLEFQRSSQLEDTLKDFESLKYFSFKPPFKGCPPSIELMQVIPREMDKSVAVRRYMQHLPVHQNNILAIGDSHNDSNMLRIEGISALTFEDAQEDIKRIPGVYVAPPAKRDGFYHAIMQIKQVIKD